MGVKSLNTNVSYDRYKFLIWAAGIEGDSYVIKDMWKDAAYYDFPKNGYIVGKESGNSYIAFKTIELHSKNKKATILTKRVCRGEKGPVFYLPKAKVVYLGDINLYIKNKEIKYYMKCKNL